MDSIALKTQITAHIKKLESFGSRCLDTEGNHGARAYIEACLDQYGGYAFQKDCRFELIVELKNWRMIANFSTPSRFIGFENPRAHVEYADCYRILSAA